MLTTSEPSKMKAGEEEDIRSACMAFCILLSKRQESAQDGRRGKRVYIVASQVIDGGRSTAAAAAAPTGDSGRCWLALVSRWQEGRRATGPARQQERECVRSERREGETRREERRE